MSRRCSCFYGRSILVGTVCRLWPSFGNFRRYSAEIGSSSRLGSFGLRLAFTNKELRREHWWRWNSWKMIKFSSKIDAIPADADADAGHNVMAASLTFIWPELRTFALQETSQCYCLLLLASGKPEFDWFRIYKPPITWNITNLQQTWITRLQRCTVQIRTLFR